MGQLADSRCSLQLNLEAYDLGFELTDPLLRFADGEITIGAFVERVPSYRCKYTLLSFYL